MYDTSSYMCILLHLATNCQHFTNISRRTAEQQQQVQAQATQSRQALFCVLKKLRTYDERNNLLLNY